MTNYKDKYNYWLNNVRDEHKQLLLSMNEGEIIEAFSGELEFGTGGIRAVMGMGSRLLNEYTFKKIAKGTADYFLEFSAKLCAAKGSLDKRGGTKKKASRSVVIAYDNRINSRLFARLTACVLAECGITAIITNECMPTPYLSFMVRKLRAAGGVMITASHNPKHYNGYKLYDAEGCQLLEGEADRAAEHIKNADPFLTKAGGFSGYKKQGMIKTTSAHRAYLAAVSEVLGKRECASRRIKNEGLYKEYDYKKSSAAVALKESMDSELRIIYTPLCGTGAFLAEKILKKEGRLFVVPKQAKPDGEFSTCPVPNPEKPEAFEMAVDYAQKFDADLVIASDPDADRMGAVARKKDGSFQFLTGNQIGMLLTDYVLSENRNSLKSSKKKFCADCGASSVGQHGTDALGGLRGVKMPVIVRTIVSTPMADSIAREYGAEIIKVPTGFKYIGDTASRLVKKGQGDRFLLGFEESHGYLSGTYARDKDGLLAAALLARYAAGLKADGLTLFDALDEIYKKHGVCIHKTISYRFEGLSGADKIRGFMQKVRLGEFLRGAGDFEVTDYNMPSFGKNPIACSGDKNASCADKTTNCKDRAGCESNHNSGSAYPAGYPADMVEYTQGGASVIIRPSGTEPFIKAYLASRADTLEEAEEILARFNALCDQFFV